MAKPHRDLVRDYRQDLRLFGSPTARAGLVAMLVGLVMLPMVVQDDFWLSVLVYVGITAVGAIGLNLLTGYCGQISLGHAFFIGAGAYVTGWVGSDLPLYLWLPAAALVGGMLGAVIGPFALRLRGHYLAIVTLGLVFIGEHLWRNWRGLTGGNSGTSINAQVALGPVDFNRVELAGEVYSRNQGYFWLVWVLVAIVALLVKNLVRTRPGRALQAVRDRDQAAEVIGVRAGRYKIGAFVVSSAIASVAGALFGSYQQFVSPDEWNLLLSIQYIAIVIVGGLGTVFGSILGAVFVGALPALIDRFGDAIPGVRTGVGGEGFISVFALNQAIFGVLIVLFLVFEPRGLAGIWLRIKAYFKSWPFSY
ncbi:branched-chain amino acid ABC transporter permease [Kibdelosporangium phytohabitans]|uniref:Branched-chain amino acid ABC transporter permease n=1 Tax=Kibdelosporangium phytohabitans TaxID=860235 RepID=A0A0N9HRG0_9PSEU|nr:branched-chain amino acid ABC transporter permease [Kibdelosporangium phytohabitans]ALG05618.1 branched-chain amino acid ABC transporter permease [Kibdelosporangium phytohabitans]MBE1466410.1 branched-chain amino acid transport system permease protein [Kibdelosporangium phytohabitans]